MAVNLYNKKLRDKVLSSIKEYYGTQVISESVRNITVDRKLYERRSKFLDASEIKQLYEEYNLKYYTGKKQFYASKEGLNMTDQQIEALWIEYEHREKLIISGQYQEFRDELFRQNYIKGLRKLGATDKEIQYFEKLSHQEILKLTNEGGANKENTSKNLLPELGLFNYNDINSIFTIRNDIQKVFKEYLNIDYEWEERKYDRLCKLFKPKTFNKYTSEIESEIDDTIEDVQSHVYYSLIEKLSPDRIRETKPDRKGRTHYYIRGFGSQVGKNKDIVDDIVSYFKIKGKL